MSASLVGSEMCIRDRPRTSCGRPPDTSRSAPPANRGVRAGGSPLGGPVSYTHLTLPTICSV
eukprot:552488-Alexandrium_andersonii.AAC.1